MPSFELLSYLLSLPLSCSCHMLSSTRDVCVCLIPPGGRAPGGSFSSMSVITSDDAHVCISRLDPTPDPKCISPTDHSVLPLEHLTGILSKTELPTCSPHCSSPQSSRWMTIFFSIFGPKSLESPLIPLSHFIFSLSSSPLESTFQMHQESDYFSSFPCPTLLWATTICHSDNRRSLRWSLSDPSLL